MLSLKQTKFVYINNKWVLSSRVKSDFYNFVIKMKNKAFYDSKRRKRFRLFQRVISGVKTTLYKGKRIRFITLTTSNKKINIKACFDTLVKRIRRKYGLFEYCRVQTPEGNGVIHLLYEGSYIERDWLKVQWEDLTSAYIVDIREMYGKGYKIAGYLMGYLGHHSEFRTSYSKKWCFSGFVKQWTRVKRYYYRYFYFKGESFYEALNRAIYHFETFLYHVGVDFKDKYFINPYRFKPSYLD